MYACNTMFACNIWNVKHNIKLAPQIQETPTIQLCAEANDVLHEHIPNKFGHEYREHEYREHEYPGLQHHQHPLKGERISRFRLLVHSFVCASSSSICACTCIMPRLLCISPRLLMHALPVQALALYMPVQTLASSCTLYLCKLQLYRGEAFSQFPICILEPVHLHK